MTGFAAGELVQILVHFSQRFLRLVGLNRGNRQERLLTLRVPKKLAERAIGPMLVFAKIHVQPRAESSADHIVHQAFHGMFRSIRALTVSVIPQIGYVADLFIGVRRAQLSVGIRSRWSITVTGIGRFCTFSFSPSCLSSASINVRPPLGSDATGATLDSPGSPVEFAASGVRTHVKLKSQPPSMPVASKTGQPGPGALFESVLRTVTS